MKAEDIQQLKDAIAKNLNTHDKRYMFLQCMFSSSITNIVARIQLEGSSEDCAWEIISFFKKQSMLGSLMAAMNHVFDLNLTFDVREDYGH